MKVWIKNEWVNIKRFRILLRNYHGSDLGTITDFYMTWIILSFIFIKILGVKI